MQQTIKKVLIFEGGGIGDVIMATPTLKGIKHFFSEAKIDIAVSSRTVDILFDRRGWNKVILLDRGIKSKNLTMSILRNLRLLFEFRRHKYDLVIDLQAVESYKSAILRYLFYKIIGSKLIAGRNTDGRGFYLTYKAAEALKGNTHEVERKLSIIKAMGGNYHNKDITISIEIKRLNYVNALLKESNLTENNIIFGINPCAFRPSRQWKHDKFIELARILSRNFKASIVIIGSNIDTELVKKILQDFKDIKAIGFTDLSLLDLAALISKFTVFITNDTGPMHIAAAVGTPTVAIFGPENYFRYGPYMDNKMKKIVAVHNVYCRPCVKFTCRNHLCMDQITVNHVLKSVESLMRKITNPEGIL